MLHDPLPPPLMTSEPGSFARAAIAERIPQIIAHVMADNGYPPDIVARLEDLQDEIARLPIRPLAGPVAADGFLAGDVAAWNRAAAAHRGKTWLELPWYFAEAFFYRRLLEAVLYFSPGPLAEHDPFGRRKRREEQQAAAGLSESWEQLTQLGAEDRFEVLLHSSLWGNRADLSMFTILEPARGGLATRGEQQRILVDQSAEVSAFFRARLPVGLNRVDFVNDNAGQELLYDLALADFLLSRGWARRILFRLKDRPFFVSDAMIQDVHSLLSLMGPEPLGRRLAEHLRTERLVLQDDPFWTSWLTFGGGQMPPPLCAELSQADLVILKGDANYRRLLGDRHWPTTARLEDIAAYFPAPFLTLRTLKAEIMVGLKPGQAEQLAAQDPAWLINGKRGLIQLVQPLRRDYACQHNR